MARRARLLHYGATTEESVGGEGVVQAEETRFADVVVLRLSGRIDQEASPQLQARLLELIGGNTAPAGIVLDLKAVPYVSSAGLRALMVGAKESKAKGRHLAVAALQPVVREVFQISRFDKVISTHAEVHEAIGTISTEAASAFNDRHAH